MISGMKSDSDCSNLTRLDDFFEEEVAYGLASAGSCDPRAHGVGNWQLSWMPIGHLNSKGRLDLAVPQERTLCEFEGLCSIVTDLKALLEIFAGKHIAEVAFRGADHHLGPIGCGPSVGLEI